MDNNLDDKKILEKAGINKNKWKEIIKKAVNQPISDIEARLINIFTPYDVLIKPFFKDSPKSYNERFEYIAHKKIIKYLILVQLKEEYGVIPKPIKRVFQKAPCGLINLGIMYLRTEHQKFYKSAQKDSK